MSRQYLNAAKVVKAVLSGESLTRYCSKHKVGKEEYALTCETLKFNEVITDLLRESGTDAQTLDVDEFVLRVMIYELFFGKKKIQGGGAVKRVIMSNFALFEKVLLEELIRKGKTSYVHLQSDIILSSSNLPKYVRINVIKMQVASGIDEIRKKFPNAEADPEIPSLIKIPPPYGGIADMNSVNTGQMIIQDKASCFPSQILFDEWSESGRRGHFIDACAAPGNKTSHLSALSWDSKTEAFSSMVFAFDRNITRCELLRSRMEQAGASNVIASCENFLDVDTSLEKYSMVTAALVDPSCSGSGVVRSLERVIERTRQPSDDQQTDERLSKLSKFQISAISKAFQFPFIRTVVYSTCSIHQVENEDVVAEILRNFPSWELKCPTRLASTWKRRGFVTSGLSESQANCLIRCHPEDGMNGFFVALFVRKQQTEQCSAKREVRDFDVSAETEVRQLKRRRHPSPRRWRPIHKLVMA